MKQDLTFFKGKLLSVELKKNYLRERERREKAVIAEKIERKKEKKEL